SWGLRQMSAIIFLGLEEQIKMLALSAGIWMRYLKRMAVYAIRSYAISIIYCIIYVGGKLQADF
ncbi:hypothetical protein MKW94_001384, partial [Papaver nudicaule]|nr:hypothetical protein [Papaver nudicaule]